MSAIATVAGGIIAAIGTVVATVVSLATSIAAIPIAIAAIGVVAAYQFGLVGSAVDALKETWTAAWGGIVASVMKGDLQTAFEIAWTSIQITFTQGWNTIKSGWRGTKDFVLSIWDGVVASIAKTVVYLVNRFEFLGKVVAAIFKGLMANAAAIGKALRTPVKTALKGIKLESNIVGDVKAIAEESAKELQETYAVLDEDFQRKQDARGAASQAAFESDKAKLGELKDKQAELIAKANEPLVSSEQEKKLEEKKKQFESAFKSLSNLTSGVSSFSTRGIRAGQSVGDKTIKEIKSGIDKLAAETKETNKLLGQQVGPGG